MHLIVVDWPNLLATATGELAIDCGTHRGSFQSFGISVELMIEVLSYDQLCTGAGVVTRHSLTFPALPEPCSLSR